MPSATSQPSATPPASFGRFIAALTSLAAFALLLWAVLAASTALERERYAVAGQIQCDGKPAAGARVRLYPLGGEQSPVRPAAWGTVAADGTFEVKTLGWAAGAPAGKYAVTVAYHPPAIRGEDFLPGPHVLAAELADPRATPLAIEVLPQTNRLGLLSLETPRAPRKFGPGPRWSEFSRGHTSHGER